MIKNPWSKLPIPNIRSSISALRVDSKNPWEFFWGRDIENKILLVLKNSQNSFSSRKIPKLKGLEVKNITNREVRENSLVFRLVDLAYRDIFYRLCIDIIESTNTASSEKEAFNVAINRTMRWHYLLKGGADGLLSPEEQKGLIGELLFLERQMLALFNVNEALCAWIGPEGAPKDFEIGNVCVEVKSRRIGAAPYIVINSEHQLDGLGIQSFFLNVVELNRASAESDDSFTLSAIAKRVLEQIFLSDGDLVELYENLLVSVGFNWEDDYSDYFWIEGANLFYAISDEFPRITAHQLHSGISNVKYSISIVECEPFLASEEEVRHVLGGIENGN